MLSDVRGEVGHAGCEERAEDPWSAFFRKERRWVNGFRRRGRGRFVRQA
jgi:hypothetical protein